MTMANRPIAYTQKGRKGIVGNLKGKIVVQVHPTGRKRVDHRSFCDEVAHATTFTGAEVEAILRLAAKIAKKYVENGDIVDFGDIGTLTPSFQSKLVEKGKEEFNPKVHITKPVVHLTPSKKYFTLTGVSYEHVIVPDKASKKRAENHSQSGPEIAIEP